MKLKDLKDRDVIANLLNDDDECLFGMYLASSYQKFKNWQEKKLFKNEGQRFVYMDLKDIGKEI